MSFNKAITQKEFVDPVTGECIPFTISKDFSTDRDFFKMFSSFIPVLNSLSKGTHKSVLFYLIEHMDNKNGITVSQNSLAKSLNLSVRTVVSVFKNLKSLNVLVMETRGRYIVNPSFIYKGSGKSRFYMLKQYDLIKNRNDSGDYVDDEVI